MSVKNDGLIIMIILLSSCKPMAHQTAHEKTLETIVVEKLGEQATIEKNKDQTFFLCYKHNSSMQNVSYLIIRSADLKIVEQDTLARATLSWIDDYKIQISVVKGIIRGDASSIKSEIIDVTKYIAKL